MNFVKPRGSVEFEKSAEREVEGNFRELVRRDNSAFRQADGDRETTANNLSALLRRLSGNSTIEIDNLISELQMLREKLQADGERVERDIPEYAALSQSVIQMTKIITESMTQVKKLPVSPTLAE
jgi:type I site-specific restriction endonuclease